MDGNWIGPGTAMVPPETHPDGLAPRPLGRPTQDSVAQRFAQAQAGRLRFCHEARAWFVWDGAAWRQDRTAIVPHRIRETTRDLSTNPSGDVFKASGRTAFVAGVERFARHDPELTAPSGFWRDPQMVLATPAGPVDLATGQAMPAAPGDGLRRVTAVAAAETAECPVWRRFLGEACGAEEVGLLRRYLGAALTGLPAEMRILFCRGPADSGKTVFLNTLLHVLGDYAAPVAPGFAAGPDRGPLDLSGLGGVRLATMSAAERGPNWNEARLSRLTGGDPVAGPGGERVTLSCKLIATGRRAPRLDHFDRSMLRYLRILPFRRGPGRPDPGLDQALRAEAPGILRWMIEGALEWRQHGLGCCEAIDKATFDHAAEENVVGAFLVERCRGEPDDRSRKVPAAKLYEAWCTFAEAAGETPGSKRGFVEAVAEHGFERLRSETTRYYFGLSLPDA